MQAAQRQFGVANEHYTRYTIERFEVCVQSLALLLDNLDHPQVHLDDNERASLVTIHSNIDELITCCRTLKSEWEQCLDLLQSQPTASAYRAPITITSSRRRGRPRFDIQHDQLFTRIFMDKYCKHTCVSRMTIYRRRSEYGLLVDPMTTFDVVNLDRVLRQLRVDSPAIGVTMVQGHLRAMGYSVPRERVRQATRKTDPLNTTLRWRSITQDDHTQYLHQIPCGISLQKIIFI